MPPNLEGSLLLIFSSAHPASLCVSYCFLVLSLVEGVFVSERSFGLVYGLARLPALVQSVDEGLLELGFSFPEKRLRFSLFASVNVGLGVVSLVHRCSFEETCLFEAAHIFLVIVE